MSRTNRFLTAFLCLATTHCTSNSESSDESRGTDNGTSGEPGDTSGVPDGTSGEPGDTSGDSDDTSGDSDDAQGYLDDDYWAALPSTADEADIEVEGTAFAEDQANADTDVFFVHPTTFIGEGPPNAEIGEPSAEILLGATLRYQASVFNHTSRVFAPRYRQAAGELFFVGGQPLADALDLAYSDVRAAFEVFLQEYNADRPFFIASHSQGSCHALRLLQEFADEPAIEERLIAAYVLGYPIPVDASPLPAAMSEGDTGRLIGFMSYAEGASIEAFTEDFPDCTRGSSYPVVGPGQTLAQINPLSWTTTGDSAPASANQGAAPMWDLTAHEVALVPEATGARIDGVLLVAPEPVMGLVEFVIDDGNYHNYDYHLFYENLRENISQRQASFFSQ